MTVETPSLFAQAIQEHLELKQRNALLEREMPIDVYKSEDPFENHPLFKTEEQARLEETMDGEPAVQIAAATTPWPGEQSGEESNSNGASETEEDTGLWSRSRDFDWGD